MSNRLISSISELVNNEYTTSENSLNREARFQITDCDIDFEIEFKNESFSTVNFNNCTFLKKVTFIDSKISRNFDFTYCTFSEDVIFRNIKIDGKSRFWESTFNKKVDLNNVSFKDLADFFKVTFSNVIIFYKVDFFSTTVFTETIFMENALFTYTKIADIIIFTRTKFEKGLDLSLAIITGKINIHSSDLKFFSNVADIYDNNLYRQAVEDNGIITLNNKRETFRILKKFSKEDYNQFKYLEYSKLENEVYFEQLKSAKWKRFNNYIIFLANKYSNDHNMNWLLGIGFTGLMGFIFFYSALISTSCIEMAWEFNTEVFIHYLGLYFNFLSPIHSFDLFALENPNTGTIALDFFGRIFVGYGIYQTIQAFRKHKG